MYVYGVCYSYRERELIGFRNHDTNACSVTTSFYWGNLSNHEESNKKQNRGYGLACLPARMLAFQTPRHSFAFLIGPPPPPLARFSPSSFFN